MMRVAPVQEEIAVLPCHVGVDLNGRTAGAAAIPTVRSEGVAIGQLLPRINGRRARRSAAAVTERTTLLTEEVRLLHSGGAGTGPAVARRAPFR